MKRYMLFSGNNYYPAGGMKDFIDSFDTIDECVEFINEKHDKENNEWDYQWYQVFDTIERKIVINSSN